MATVAVVRAQRKNASGGREHYDRFIKWCKKSKFTPDPKLFMTWDETHNSFRFRKLFGSKDDVYKAGLLTLYTRHFYNFSMLRIAKTTGKGFVSISPYRRSGSNGKWSNVFSPKTSEEDIAFIRSKAVLTVQNQAERIKRFNTREEIIVLFTDAVESVFVENQVAAD